MALTIQSAASKVSASADLSRALQDIIKTHQLRLEQWQAVQTLLGMFGLGLTVNSYVVNHAGTMDLSDLSVSMEIGQELAEVLRAYESFRTSTRWYDLPAEEGVGKTASILLSTVQLTVTVRECTPDVTTVVLQNFTW